jgi:hypothetical protein
MGESFINQTRLEMMYRMKIVVSGNKEDKLLVHYYGPVGDYKYNTGLYKNDGFKFDLGQRENVVLINNQQPNLLFTHTTHDEYYTVLHFKVMNKPQTLLKRWLSYLLSLPKRV